MTYPASRPATLQPAQACGLFPARRSSGSSSSRSCHRQTPNNSKAGSHTLMVRQVRATCIQGGKGAPCRTPHRGNRPKRWFLGGGGGLLWKWRRGVTSVAAAVAPGCAEEDQLVLTGDVGGTNSRLQLWAIKEGDECQGTSEDEDGVTIPGNLLYENKYSNENFASFSDVLAGFLGEAVASAGVAEGEPISVAVFAVAGPTENDRVLFTNRSDWTIDGQELEASVNIKKCRLLNDFVANGYGLLTLGKKDLHCLQDVPKVDGAPIALLGAGTGLGECFLTASEGGVYTCWPTEGGHVEFSPRSKTELQLLSSLMDRFSTNHRVSVERIVSGKGIANVYDFFRQRYPGAVDKVVDDAIMSSGDMKGGVVAQNYHNDTLCRWTMEVVWGTYGSEAGNVALKFMPLGGLYIAGGLAPKNMFLFEEEWLVEGQPTSFMSMFSEKGRLSAFLTKVPVNVVLNEGIGQAGAHLVAWRLLNGIQV